MKEFRSFATTKKLFFSYAYPQYPGQCLIKVIMCPLSVMFLNQGHSVHPVSPCKVLPNPVKLHQALQSLAAPPLSFADPCKALLSPVKPHQALQSFLGPCKRIAEPP